MTIFESLSPSEIIAQMKRDIDWRGPSGKPLGHIVLTRAQAKVLVVAASYHLFQEPPRETE